MQLVGGAADSGQSRLMFEQVSRAGPQTEEREEEHRGEEKNQSSFFATTLCFSSLIRLV